jgi:hypothetical protein
VIFLIEKKGKNMKIKLKCSKCKRVMKNNGIKNDECYEYKCPKCNHIILYFTDMRKIDYYKSCCSLTAQMLINADSYVGEDKIPPKLIIEENQKKNINIEKKKSKKEKNKKEKIIEPKKVEKKIELKVKDKNFEKKQVSLDDIF